MRFGQLVGRLRRAFGPVEYVTRLRVVPKFTRENQNQTQKAETREVEDYGSGSKYGNSWCDGLGPCMPTCEF